MANGPLHKLCHSCPWGQIWPRPGGSIVSIDLLWEKNSKIFFSETTGPTALIFGMWQWLMVLYINCASHAPGVKFGHAPGVDSLHRLTIGKTKLEDHWSCSSPERLSHCKLMRFKLIENRPMKVYAWTLLTPWAWPNLTQGHDWHNL